MICINCNKEYERKTGILIPVCQDCIDKPKEEYREPYISKNGLLIPNAKS